MSQLPYEYESFEETELNDSHRPGLFDWWVSYNNFLDWSFASTITISFTMLLCIGGFYFGAAVIWAAFRVASVIANFLVWLVTNIPGAIYGFFASVPELLLKCWGFIVWVCIDRIPSWTCFLLTNWLTVLLTFVVLHFTVRLLLSWWNFRIEEEAGEGFIRGGSIEEGYATQDMFPDDNFSDQWRDKSLKTTAFPNLNTSIGFTINTFFEAIAAFCRGFSGK
jgi:hypothetical protein